MGAKLAVGRARQLRAIPDHRRLAEPAKIVLCPMGHGLANFSGDPSRRIKKPQHTMSTTPTDTNGSAIAAPTTTEPGSRPLLDADFFRAHFEAAHQWEDYLASGKESQRENWLTIYNQVSLAPAQEKLLNSFTRTMNLVCLSGIWCGDCVQQGPLIQNIADACAKINLRWLDRDEHPELANEFMINAGSRVPVLLFLAEDFEFVAAYGDRTLTRYRAMAEAQLGPSCPLPGAPVPTDQLTATMNDWLNEIERVQLLLRLSTRLRKAHND